MGYANPSLPILVLPHPCSSAWSRQSALPSHSQLSGTQRMLPSQRRAHSCVGFQQFNSSEPSGHCCTPSQCSLPSMHLFPLRHLKTPRIDVVLSDFFHFFRKREGAKNRPWSHIQKWPYSPSTEVWCRGGRGWVGGFLPRKHWALEGHAGPTVS